MAENGSTIEMELNVTPKESSLQETTKKTADSLSKASKFGAKAYSNAMKSATKEFVSYLQEEMGKASTKIRKGGLSERGIINQVIGDLSSGKLKLDKASSYIKNFGKETNKVLDEQKKKVTILDAVWSEMTKNIGKRVSIFASYKAIGAMTGLLESSLSSIIQLEKEFANIQAITASSQGTMASLSRTIFEVGSNSMYTNEELAKATVTLGQAGYSAQEIEKLLESVSQLAAATGTDLATSVQVATSALTVWNLEASQMTRVADVLTTAVNATKAEIGTIANGIQYAGAMFSDLGISLEESVALFSAVTNAGLKARSVVGTGSRALVTELITPTEKLQKVLTRLGLTLDDVDVRSKGVTNVLQTLKDAGFGAEEAFEAMDRRAATFYSAATSQLETMKNLVVQFQLSGSTAKAAETQMNTLSAQLNRLKNSIVETTTKGFAPLVDMLKGLLKALNEVLSVPFVKEIIGFAAAAKLLTGTLGLGVSALSTGLTMYSKVAKTSIKDTTKLVTSLGALKNVLFSLKGAVYLGVGLGIYEGVKYLYREFLSTEEAIVRLEADTNTYNTTMNSLDSVYEDLINKQEIYRNDSSALSLKVAELNKQFGEQNGLLLSQVDTWDELIKKLNEYRFAREKEQAERTKETAKKREQAATPLEVSSIGVMGADGSYIPQYTESSKKGEFARLLNATDEAFFKHIEDISRIVDKEKRESEMAFAQEVLKARQENKLSFAQLTSSNIGGVVNDFVNESIKEMTSIEDAYKKASEELMKEGNTFKPQEALDNINDANEKLKNLYIQVDEYSKTLVEKFPQLKDQNVEVNKILTQLKDDLKSKSMNLTKGLNDETIKFIEEQYKIAKETFNNVVKMAKTEQISGTKGESLLRQALDNFLVYVGLKESVDLNKANTKDSMAGPRMDEISKKFSSERGKAMSEAEAGIARITDRAKSAKSEITRLQEAIRDLNRAAETKKEGVKGSLGYYEKSGTLAGLEATNASPSTIRDARIKFERAQMEYDEKALSIDKQLLSNLQEKKKLVDGEVESKRISWEAANNEMKALQNNIEKQAEFDMAKEKERDLNQELVGLKTIQNDLDKQILDKQAGITEEQIRQSLLKGNVGPDGKPKTPTETNEYKGMQGGRDKYFNEGVKAFQEFGPVAQTTYEAISQLETGFADLFKNIADGSMSAGDALKSMVSNFISSMADFIVSISAKAAVLAALSAIPGMPALLSSLDSMAWLQTAKKASDAANIANAANAAANTSGKASGGPVVGGVPNRDSVPTRLMPGEFVMKKSAVSALGEDFLTNLNNNTAATMNAMKGSTVVQNNEPSVVNVWVVADKEQAQMGPNDIIATISKDIRTGGTTKKLIQSVVAGRKA